MSADSVKTWPDYYNHGESLPSYLLGCAATDDYTGFPKTILFFGGDEIFVAEIAIELVSQLSETKVSVRELVLDEATANVDPENEDRLQKAIEWKLEASRRIDIILKNNYTKDEVYSYIKACDGVG